MSDSVIYGAHCKRNSASTATRSRCRNPTAGLRLSPTWPSDHSRTWGLVRREGVPSRMRVSATQEGHTSRSAKQHNGITVSEANPLARTVASVCTPGCNPSRCDRHQRVVLFAADSAMPTRAAPPTQVRASPMTSGPLVSQPCRDRVRPVAGSASTPVRLISRVVGFRVRGASPCYS